MFAFFRLMYCRARQYSGPAMTALSLYGPYIFSAVPQPPLNVQDMSSSALLNCLLHPNNARHANTHNILIYFNASYFLFNLLITSVVMSSFALPYTIFPLPDAPRMISYPSSSPYSFKKELILTIIGCISFDSCSFNCLSVSVLYLSRS